MLKRRIINVNFIVTFELINNYLLFSCTMRDFLVHIKSFWEIPTL